MSSNMVQTRIRVSFEWPVDNDGYRRWVYSVDRDLERWVDCQQKYLHIKLIHTINSVGKFESVAWPIRDDLIPLFGPTFPSTCLSPDQPGFGQVVASGPNRRRTRRNPQPNTSLNPPREPWTVVTPHDPAHTRQPPPPQPPYLHTAFYPSNRDGNSHHSYQHSSLPSPHDGSASIDDPASPSSTSRSSVRYSPYNVPYPISRPSLEGRKDLSLDIPSLSLRDNVLPPPSCRISPMEHITLPPIHSPPDLQHSTSPYALPPISAMEDLRGLHVNDSAAVLRRLKADDPSSGDTRRSDERRRLLHPTIRYVDPVSPELFLG
ncbi:hypothetical protein C0992_009447 [Termitomyces sp. T32_za158]|nr:hypothetical protein C0992_009447 [Termitomyces sp. T32_za158]